ncbi:hypothetical protein D3C81_1237280 [compost metagenome]
MRQLVGAIAQATGHIDHTITGADELCRLSVACHVRVGPAPGFTRHVGVQIALFFERLQRIDCQGSSRHALEGDHQQAGDPIQFTVRCHSLIERMLAPFGLDDCGFPSGTAGGGGSITHDHQAHRPCEIGQQRRNSLVCVPRIALFKHQHTRHGALASVLQCHACLAKPLQQHRRDVTA